MNMLSVKEAIEQRRSIRQYKDTSVSDEAITQILEAARLAPSSSNLQPWYFVVVKDQTKKNELSEICWGQRDIADAPVNIVCFADYNMYSRDERAKRRTESAPSAAAASAVPKTPSRFEDPKFREYVKSHPLPPGQDTLSSIVANTFIAIENICLMAAGLGLGTCWIGGFTEYKKLNELFGLGENMVPVAVVPVGYAEGPLPKARSRRSLSEISKWV
jgi:nitroreductase